MFGVGKGPKEPGVYPGGSLGPGSAVLHELCKMSSECVGEGGTVRAADSLGLFARSCFLSSWKAAGKRFCPRSPLVVKLLPFSSFPGGHPAARGGI